MMTWVKGSARRTIVGVVMSVGGGEERMSERPEVKKKRGKEELWRRQFIGPKLSRAGRKRDNTAHSERRIEFIYSPFSLGTLTVVARVDGMD